MLDEATAITNQLKCCGIYTITNKTNGKRYVGKTIKPFSHRWRQHSFALSRNRHTNARLQNDWNVLGADAFGFAALYVLPSSFPIVASKVIHTLETFFIGSDPCGVYNESRQFTYSDRIVLQWAVREGLLVDVPGL